MKFIAEYWPGWSDGSSWVVIDKDLEPCEKNNGGMVADGFMTEAKAIEYISERMKMEETDYRDLNKGEKPQKRCPPPSAARAWPRKQSSFSAIG